MRLRAIVVSLALLATLLAGCGSDDDDTTLQVFAAASLRGSFENIADAFEDEHADVEVRFNFAGSSELALQITEGADADVIATADEATMAGVATLLASRATVFAHNTLRIVVPAGNPDNVTSLVDLGGTDLVVCAPQVPCGAAAQRVAEAAGITLAPVSEELNVTEVLSKVTSGQASAGLVYLTDVIAAGDAVEGIDFAESSEAVNRYPIARLDDSAQAGLADEFVAFVHSDAGQQLLRDAGFAAP